MSSNNCGQKQNLARSNFSPVPSIASCQWGSIRVKVVISIICPPPTLHWGSQKVHSWIKHVPRRDWVRWNVSKCLFIRSSRFLRYLPHSTAQDVWLFAISINLHDNSFCCKKIIRIKQKIYQTVSIGVWGPIKFLSISSPSLSLSCPPMWHLCQEPSQCKTITFLQMRIFRCGCIICISTPVSQQVGH